MLFYSIYFRWMCAGLMATMIDMSFVLTFASALSIASCVHVCFVILHMHVHVSIRIRIRVRIRIHVHVRMRIRIRICVG